MDFTPVNDFFSNIKDKLTNPFFGTLIIVWLTRNWLLVYTIFNFDEKHNLNSKVEFIKNYWSTKDFLVDLAICAWHAILFMLAGYIIIIFTRSISMLVEHNIMPNITDKIVSNDVVSKKIYNVVKKERDEYSDSYENERSKVRESSKNYTQQLSLNEELKSNLAKTDKVNEELRTSNTKLKENEDKFTKEKSELNEKIKKLNREIESNSAQISSLKLTLSSSNIDLTNTELNSQIWHAIREFFNLPKEITDLFHLIEETPGTLTFDRSHFNMQAYGGNIQQFLYTMQSANLGHIKNMPAVDKLIEFELYDDGRNFLNLLKLFKNFKTQFNYI